MLHECRVLTNAHCINVNIYIHKRYVIVMLSCKFDTKKCYM